MKSLLRKMFIISKNIQIFIHCQHINFTRTIFTFHNFISLPRAQNDLLGQKVDPILDYSACLCPGDL